MRRCYYFIPFLIFLFGVCFAPASAWPQGNTRKKEIVRCVMCNGSGNCRFCNGSGKKQCGGCYGSGKVPGVVKDQDGKATMASVDHELCRGTGKLDCDNCNGSGKCNTCNGAGTFEK